MKKLNLTLTVILTLGLTFTSCKKDDSSEPTHQNTVNKEKTLEETLVGKKWVITAIKFEEPIDLGTGELITDLYEYLEECERDNYMLYNEDGTGVSGPGELKCYVDEESSDFLWYINPDDKKEFWVDMNGVNTVYSATDISDEKIIVETDAEVGADMVPVTIHLEPTV